MDNLMQDPIIRLVTAGGESEVHTLPGVLAALTRGEVVSFSALQPHQSHAWHAFLVQLAAIALHRAGEWVPPTGEEAWRELLRALTGAWPGYEPWRLVVADLAQPAFMQPPVPEGHLGGFNKQFPQPDRLDVLVTAKDHDIKMARINHPRPDHWVMALVMLQTMEGFMGAGNYGIARMNGGFASRPGVGVRPDPSPGGHFRRDLALLLRDRDGLLQRFPELYAGEGGESLLWLLPWDGQTSLSLKSLDPYFIEVCRRVRLVNGENGLTAHGATSKQARVEAKSFNGNLGDPWTPVVRAAKTDPDKSLSIQGKGFDYALVADLILGDDTFLPAPAQSQEPSTAPGNAEFFARAMARGQGITEGYHERRVPLPARVRIVLGRPQERAALAGRAKQQVQHVGTISRQVLKPALLTMIQEAPDKLDFRDTRADSWLKRLEQRVDDAFFPSLWASLDKSPEEAETAWLTFLRESAREVMVVAEGALVGGGARRYKTLATAERVFHGALVKQFPQFRAHEGTTTVEEER